MAGMGMGEGEPADGELSQLLLDFGGVIASVDDHRLLGLGARNEVAVGVLRPHVDLLNAESRH